MTMIRTSLHRRSDGEAPTRSTETLVSRLHSAPQPLLEINNINKRCRQLVIIRRYRAATGRSDMPPALHYSI